MTVKGVSLYWQREYLVNLVDVYLESMIVKEIWITCEVGSVMMMMMMFVITDHDSGGKGLTLTFQLTSLVASVNLDATSQNFCLLAKRRQSEMFSLTMTETCSVNFILFTSQSG